MILVFEGFGLMVKFEVKWGREFLKFWSFLVVIVNGFDFVINGFNLVVNVIVLD